MDWGPTVWGPTVLCHRMWIWATTHWTVGLQSGGLQSRSTDFGFGQPLNGVGAYSLGAHSLGPPILDLGNHSLDWGPTVWGPTVSGHRCWIWATTHWTGGLQSGGLQSRATKKLWRSKPLFFRRDIEDPYLNSKRCVGNKDRPKQAASWLLLAPPGYVNLMCGSQ